MNKENDLSEKVNKRKRSMTKTCFLKGSIKLVMFLRKEDLPEFVNGGHNYNNIRYTNDTVLMGDSEEKTQRAIRQGDQKMSINCKET